MQVPSEASISESSNILQSCCLDCPCPGYSVVSKAVQLECFERRLGLYFGCLPQAWSVSAALAGDVQSDWLLVFNKPRTTKTI
jgi:hypothetical protein